jgi:hypothetical protein
MTRHASSGSGVFWIVLTTFFVLIAGVAGFAADKPAIPEPGICFARTWGIRPLDPAGDGTSARWAVWLRTAPNVPAGLTNGVVSLVGDSERYDIPVTNFYTPSTVTEDYLAVRASPFVVRFRKPVKIILAYVASLNGNNDPGPCYHYSTFAEPPKADTGTSSVVSAATLDYVRSVPPVDAPVPVPDPPLPNCVDDGKVTYPKATSSVNPHGKMNITAVGDLVTIVRMDLTDEGIIASAVISKSSGDSAFDRDVVISANASKYSGGQFHCRPAGGSYLFKAEMDNVYKQ